MQWFKNLMGGSTAVTRERRQSYRVKFNLDGLLVMPPTAAVPCQVVDLSNSGVRVVLSHPLRRGAVVKLMLQGRPSGDSGDVLAVDARVAWTLVAGHRYTAGLEFRGERWGVMRAIADFLRTHNLGEVQTDLAQRRRSLRLEGRHPVRFRVGDGEYLEGTTHDVSETGVRFDSPRPLEPSSQVEGWLTVADRSEPLLFIGDVLRCNTGETSHEVTVQIAHVVA
jgi:hypothetical protein